MTNDIRWFTALLFNMKLMDPSVRDVQYNASSSYIVLVRKSRTYYRRSDGRHTLIGGSQIRKL